MKAATTLFRSWDRALADGGSPEGGLPVEGWFILGHCVLLV